MINKFNQPTKLKSDIGEGIAKNVYCEMTNIVSYGYSLEPFQGGKFPTTSTGEAEITSSNFCLKTNYIINELKKITIYGNLCKYNNYNNEFYYMEQDFEKPWFLENNSILYYYYYTDNPYSNPQQKLIKIVDRITYINLTDDELNNNDIIYIYYYDNKIFFDNLNKKIFDQNTIGGMSYCSDVEWENGVVGSYTILLRSLISEWNSAKENLPSGKNIDLSTCLFQVEYSYTSGDSSFPILLSNNSKYDDTVYYNQTSQRIDPNRIARILQTYIDNMASGSLMISGTFKNWKDIPKEGNVLFNKQNKTKYIINSISISEYANYLEATAQLTEFHAKRRTNMGADTNLQLNYIPNNDLVYRKSLKCIHFLYDLSIDGIKEKSSFNVEKLDFLLKDDLTKLVFRNYFTTKIGDYNLIGHPTILRAGNNILFNQRAYSNIIWDYSVYSNIPIPYNYTDEKGFINSITIYLYKDITEEQLKAYPLFKDAVEEQELILEHNMDKDAYEIFDYTLQASYKGINNTIVKEEYIEELLNNSEFLNITIRLYSSFFGKYDIINDEFEVKRFETELGKPFYSSEDGIYIITTNLSFAGVVPAYKSIVIFSDEKPIFIKNLEEERTTIEDFPIYIYPKEGTYIRTGVYGINPEEERS